MSPVRVTWRRTLGQARHAVFTSFIVGGCLAAMGLVLSFNMEMSEGLRRTLCGLWVESVSPVMPIVAALLAMGVWSDERRSGRIDLLLSTPVQEWDLVLGKFLGVLTLTLLTAVFSFVSFWLSLSVFAPGLTAETRLFEIIPAFLAILLQSTLWCAVSVATSALFHSAAVAATLSVVLTLGLPCCMWLGLISWSPEGRTAFGQNPISAAALDISGGTISFLNLSVSLVGTGAFLYFAAQTLASLRLVGRGLKLPRLTARVIRLLVVVFSILSISLAARLDFTVEIPVASLGRGLSARTLDALRESEGTVSVTCFLPRSDARFREVARLMRLLKQSSESLGGAEFVLQYVDPCWDLGAAERLVSRGVMENCLVFERGHRLVSVNLEGTGAHERDCAAAIRRLATVPRWRNIYWTTGHGECRYDDYGPFGMSDIARDLAKDGYVNRVLDVATTEKIPGDCALMVIAGAKDLFSRTEFGRIESYLREGGRVLILLGSSREGGVSPILPTWGIRLSAEEPVGEATQSGVDILVSDFADHPLSAPLRGSRIVLERPAAFAPSAVAETKVGADSIEYTPLARSGSRTLAVAVERGARAGSDLAIRPSRLVVVGDTSFAMNAPLAARANANRDFFLNCAAYLAGTDAMASSGAESGLFITGFNRQDRFRYMLHIAFCCPFVAFIFLLALSRRRRRRS